MKLKKQKKKFILPVIIIIIIILLFLIFVIFVPKKKSIQYDNITIFSDLREKIKTVDSFGTDYIVQGKTIKRMYFKIDGSAMRSEWVRGGEEYIYISNIKGSYEYYPNRNIAYLTPSVKNNQIIESSENDKLDNMLESMFQGEKVIGEELINGKECYLTEINNKPGIPNGSRICYWKENGLRLKEEFPGSGILYNDNFKFNIDDSIFDIPDGVEIVE